MGSRVDMFAAIRRDARVEELSIRELARRHHVGRATVRQALASPEPPPKKTRMRSAARLDQFKPAIDAMLRDDLTAPRKQRHTATRILDRLIVEHAATELSYSTVRNYVRFRRPEIDAAAERRVEIASNESFSGWTKTFTDRLCAAIVDRLTFGGSIIETGVDSYRLAHTRRLTEVS